MEKQQKKWAVTRKKGLLAGGSTRQVGPLGRNDVEKEIPGKTSS